MSALGYNIASHPLYFVRSGRIGIWDGEGMMYTGSDVRIYSNTSGSESWVAVGLLVNIAPDLINIVDRWNMFPLRFVTPSALWF